MTKADFLYYASEIQKYCSMLARASDVTGIEYFESEFASPLDIMETMIFNQFDKQFDDSMSERFWNIALTEEADMDDWAYFYDKLMEE